MNLSTNFLFFSVARVGPFQDAVLVPDHTLAIVGQGIAHNAQYHPPPAAGATADQQKAYYLTQFSHPRRAQWAQFRNGVWGNLQRCGIYPETPQL
jgi:hypothetical protein